MQADQALAHLVRQVLQQRRVDVAGANGVDTHAARRRLDGQRARQVEHPALGRRIRRRAALAQRAQDRAAVDDAARALAVHLPQRGARGAEHAVQVDVDGAQPVGIGVVGGIGHAADAGVGKHDVDAAQFLGGVGHQRIDLLGRGHVAGHEQAAAALPIQRLGARGAVAAGQIGQHHIGAFLQAALHRGQADAAGAAGDDHVLALQSHGVPFA